MAHRTILLVDDDRDMREALREQFDAHREFSLIEESTAQNGLETARAQGIDLLIMDIGLPDMDGREAVKILRQERFKPPIIMLTGHDGEKDTIAGLEAGANDYVAKPFKFAVLLARVRAQMRQHERSEDAVFSIGPYSFQPARKTLLRKDKSKVRLTEKETAILRYLYQAGREGVSRNALLRDVWGYSADVMTHTLETHIYRLRRKIEQNPERAQMLVTQAGCYKLLP